jgi:hypothetical protein
MFQHIVPAEVAKQVMFTVKGDLGDLGSTDFNDGTSATYLPNIFGFEEGWMFEQACPSRDCEGQWDAIVERGDVLGVFFGHDHINCFTSEINGVNIIQTPGASFRSYGKEITRGVRVFEIDESDPSKFSTYTIGYFDLFGKNFWSVLRYIMGADEKEVIRDIVWGLMAIFGVAFVVYILGITHLLGM